MKREPIFLQPTFSERIWGGRKLQDLFDYPIPSERTGEAWGIAAHPHGSSVIMNGSLKGEQLSEAWEQHPELFGKESANQAFPLLVKIIDAADYLSVQVHPDDENASKFAGESYGKTECWYILDAEADAEIIFGHHALTKAQFLSMVEGNDWERLLKRQKVQKGDFIFVPSGTVHAIGKGIVLLETQQNSDVTFRIYDFNRVDEEGRSRELHLDLAADVITFPHEVPTFQPLENRNADLKIVRLIETAYFTVYHWQLDGKVKNPLQSDYLLMTVIEGEGILRVDEAEYDLFKGNNLILPYTIDTYEIEGNVEIIVSHE